MSTSPMLLMLLFLGAATPAPVSRVTAEAALPAGVRPLETRFDVDEKLGTAWVNVEYLVLDDPFGELEFGETKVQVPGLSYDRAMHAVLLDAAGGSVVCATKKRALFRTTYPETPACRLSLGEALTADAGRLVLEIPPIPTAQAEALGAKR